MKEFDKAIITKNGNELIAEAIAGEKIEFTRLITGCGIYEETEELECAVALKEEKQEFQFSVNEKISENGVLLTAVISNVGLESGYRLTEIGIGGKLQDSEEEILYAINITGEEKAYFLPPYNGLEATEIELSCYITIKQDAELKMALGDVVDMMLNELSKENARAITAEKELERNLTALTESLTEEVTRATAAEEELEGNLNTLTESLTEEVARATAAEEELNNRIDFILRNKEILNFNENNECVIEDERITADSLADVYFTSDTISIATDAVITVETYDRNVKLSCQNVPAGAIKASIKIKVV